MQSSMPADEVVIDLTGEMFRLALRDGGLMRKLRQGPQRTLNAAMIVAQRFAPECENYMKNNAPWTDRTGNARNGLAARAFRDGSEVGIVLYHQVDYGIWLETRWSGKYAIIQPTIDEMGPNAMRAFERTLDRI